MEKIFSLFKQIYSKVIDKKSLLISGIVTCVFVSFFALLCYFVSNIYFVRLIGCCVFLLMSTILLLATVGAFVFLLHRLRCEFIYNAMFCYTPFFQTIREIRLRSARKGNNPIRVGFYCDGGEFWATFSSLYELLKEDENFETVVLAAPEMLNRKIYKYDAPSFFEKKGISYIKCYENGNWYNIKSLKLDYVFYNRHYINRQPSKCSFNKVRKYARICYISYGMCPQKGAVERTVCGFERLRAFDYVFSESKSLTQIYNSYKEEYGRVATRVETVGSTKYEYAVENATSKSTSKYKQCILYTPRWCFHEGTCSFFELKDYFFQLVKNNKDVEYVFRPHPLMKQSVVENLGDDYWESFLSEFDKYENAYVDQTNDYMSSFSKASCIVSDLSSMMFEFAATNKPVIYMYKMDKLNQYGIEASKGFYFCYNVDELDKILSELREGKDILEEIRKISTEKVYFNGNKKPSSMIRDVLCSNHRYLR